MRDQAKRTRQYHTVSAHPQVQVYIIGHVMYKQPNCTCINVMRQPAHRTLSATKLKHRNHVESPQRVAPKSSIAGVAEIAAGQVTDETAIASTSSAHGKHAPHPCAAHDNNQKLLMHLTHPTVVFASYTPTKHADSRPSTLSVNSLPISSTLSV